MRTPGQVGGDFSRKIGQRIRWLREIQDLSTGEIQKRCGIQAKTLARYERGGISISANAIEQLAIALNVSPTRLCGPVDDFSQLVREQVGARDEADWRTIEAGLTFKVQEELRAELRSVQQGSEKACAALRAESQRWREVAEGLAAAHYIISPDLRSEKHRAALAAFERAGASFDDPHLPSFTTARINPESKP